MKNYTLSFAVTAMFYMLFSCSESRINKEPLKAIISGISWFDQNKNEVNAHGTCIVREEGTYYMFGEYKSDTCNHFSGFACYSSSDLTNWSFERIVLPVQSDGLLGPERVGERPKVMKCPTTGEYVMYMHCDNPGYKDPHIGYATCPTINGEYTFHGDLPHGDSYIRRWDMGTFCDTDGKGYLLTHSGNIYELSEDYKSVKRIVSEGDCKGEAPAMFKHKGLYYRIFSDMTHWERNDNYYYTSRSIEGPWLLKGYLTPKGTLTWNSQSTYVLPIETEKDTLFMFMGDRWSYPRQGSAATYVWQPITFYPDSSIFIPDFSNAWEMDKQSGQWKTVNTGLKDFSLKRVKTEGHWSKRDNVLKSNQEGAIASFKFYGKQLAIYGKCGYTSGYAGITICNSDGEKVLETVVDFYSKYDTEGLKFLSPNLKNDKYSVTIKVTGDYPSSKDKKGNKFGSTDSFITISQIQID